MRPKRSRDRCTMAGTPSTFGLQHEIVQVTRHPAAISRSPEGQGSTRDDDRPRTSRNREAEWGCTPSGSGRASAHFSAEPAEPRGLAGAGRGAPRLGGNQTQPRGRGRRGLDKLDQRSPRHQLEGALRGDPGVRRDDGNRRSPPTKIPAFAGMTETGGLHRRRSRRSPERRKQEVSTDEDPGVRLDDGSRRSRRSPG